MPHLKIRGQACQPHGRDEAGVRGRGRSVASFLMYTRVASTWSVHKVISYPCRTGDDRSSFLFLCLHHQHGYYNESKYQGHCDQLLMKCSEIRSSMYIRPR
jgi:hypothetical protein